VGRQLREHQLVEFPHGDIAELLPARSSIIDCLRLNDPITERWGEPLKNPRLAFSRIARVLCFEVS
jgi:hypothetical protein